MLKVFPVIAVCAFCAGAQTLTITTASLPRGVQNEPYSGTLAASGGAPPYTWSLNRAASPPRLDGLVLNPANGQISGTPTKDVCCAVTVTVTDSRGAQASKSEFLSIAPQLRVGQPVPSSCPAQCLGLDVGIQPTATCDVVAGSLPPGLTWAHSSTNQDCVLAGTPTTVGAFPVMLNASGRAAAQAADEVLQVRIGAANPPAATVGAAYDQTIAPLGGKSPYQFSVTAGSLPAGLSIDATSGHITGTPTRFEYQPFALSITDSAQNTSVIPMGIDVQLPVLQPSDLTVNVPTSAAAGQNIPISLTLNKPLPLDLTAVLGAQFYPDPTLGIDDPNIQLNVSASNVQALDPRFAVFSVPANTSTAPAGITLNTGTTAGDLVVIPLLAAGLVRVMTPNPTPYSVIHIGKTAPVIQSVTAAASPGGITVTITGFSTSRELTQAAITLTPGSGITLATSSLTVPLSSGAAAWYGSSQSQQYGTQVAITIPITLGDGAKDVASVSVTLSNSAGTSAPVTAAVTQ